MNESVLWILAGALSTLLGMWIFYLARRWHHQRRYGTPITHEELLVAYGRQMAGLLDREAIGQLLAADVPGALDVSRAVVLLSEGHNLVATGDDALRLPVHHAVDLSKDRSQVSANAPLRCTSPRSSAAATEGGSP